MLTYRRQDAIHAFHLLNHFIGDLATGTWVRRFFPSPDNSAGSISYAVSSMVAVGVNRMCFSHLFLTLDKWSEFYDRFHHIIPEDCRAECKRLCREIQRRGIKRFRNTYVGHIWDKEQNRPLTLEEIETAINTIVDGDQDTFSQWCNHFEENPYPSTIISIVEHARDRIREAFDLRGYRPGRSFLFF